MSAELSFCHVLRSPEVCLVASKETEKFIKILFVRMKGTHCFGVTIKAQDHKNADLLFKPVKELDVRLFQRKMTIRANSCPIFENLLVTEVSPDVAMTDMAENFAKLSARLDTPMAVKSQKTSLKKEACDLLMKIEKQKEEQFAKFVLILNEKKRKIRELQRKLGVQLDPEPDDFGLKVADCRESVTSTSEPLEIEEAPEVLDDSDGVSGHGDSLVSGDGDSDSFKDEGEPDDELIDSESDLPSVSESHQLPKEGAEDDRASPSASKEITPTEGSHMETESTVPQPEEPNSIRTPDPLMSTSGTKRTTRALKSSLDMLDDLL